MAARPTGPAPLRHIQRTHTKHVGCTSINDASFGPSKSLCTILSPPPAPQMYAEVVWSLRLPLHHLVTTSRSLNECGGRFDPLAPSALSCRHLPLFKRARTSFGPSNSLCTISSPPPTLYTSAVLVWTLQLPLHRLVTTPHSSNERGGRFNPLAPSAPSRRHLHSSNERGPRLDPPTPSAPSRHHLPLLERVWRSF
jgi:hypothetical protein